MFSLFKQGWGFFFPTPKKYCFFLLSFLSGGGGGFFFCGLLGPTLFGFSPVCLNIRVEKKKTPPKTKNGWWGRFLVVNQPFLPFFLKQNFFFFLTTKAG